ncbi:DENN domain-containing protein 11-like [Rhopilema esculentum]|uniref:DENN domain-containing protein 11-like n=1 Tax=Rhopilema esculentum TaxID=499914 RepID=UPI0031DDD5E8
MSDVAVLVEEDELEREKMNGMLINVAPLHGIENVGFESEVSENASKVGASRQDTARNDDEQTDFIMALFVVVFDTRHGNEIEWHIPDCIDLEGVEFKALVSGSHTVSQDFVYFKHRGFYGVSCFGKMSVANEEERHARMKSVGVICKDYTSLHEHMSFLEEQVRQQLTRPASYKELVDYYNEFRQCPHKNNTTVLLERNHLHAVDELPILKITHPAGCFSQFIKYFGEKIFILWKLILLQSRILFFAPPPAGISSYRVYCTCLLGSHAVPFVADWNPNPLFSINVTDIPMLTSKEQYVACTTEKIFETKTDVYDAYVDNQNLRLSERLALIGKINNGDKKRYQQLCMYSDEEFVSGKEVYDDETLYTRFFVEANNRLFKVLYEIASHEDRTLTAEAVYEMGLDPYGDRLFIALIVDLYDIHVILPNVSCC